VSWLPLHRQAQGLSKFLQGKRAFQPYNTIQGWNPFVNRVHDGIGRPGGTTATSVDREPGRPPAAHHSRTDAHYHYVQDEAAICFARQIRQPSTTLVHGRQAQAAAAKPRIGHFRGEKGRSLARSQHARRELTTDALGPLSLDRGHRAVGQRGEHAGVARQPPPLGEWPRTADCWGRRGRGPARAPPATHVPAMCALRFAGT
jgi:hypothetical protein